MFYKQGSARYLDRLLQPPMHSHYNNIETKLQLSVDHVRIMDYLHNSPIGVRVQCDGGTPHKLLSQYLITDDLQLIVNDVDSLKEVANDGGCDARPNMSIQRPVSCHLWDMTECPLRKGVHLWEIQNVFVCENMSKCLLRRNICLREAKNVVFVCVWDHD